MYLLSRTSLQVCLLKATRSIYRSSVEALSQSLELLGQLRKPSEDPYLGGLSIKGWEPYTTPGYWGLLGSLLSFCELIHPWSRLFQGTSVTSCVAQLCLCIFLWSHIPCIAIVPDTSNILQNHIGNHLGL